MSEKYFSQLNYTLANEDTTLEYTLLQQFLPANILAVGGSGGRSLPLVSKASKKLHIIDLSSAQLALINLRKEAIAHFSLDDYRCFWGMPPYQAQSDGARRAQLFHQLPLTPTEKSVFVTMFTTHRWNALLYQGKWERTFQMFSQLAQLMMGRKHLEQLLWNFDLQQQRTFFAEHFRHQRWRWVVRFLGNATMFNSMLYRGHFVQKNLPLSHFEFYLQAFNCNFHHNLVRENFFLQLCFWGQLVTPEALPIEAQGDCYSTMQACHPQMEVRLMKGNIVDYCARMERPTYDFLSLSDVPSYFSGELEQNYFQKLRPALRPGAILVVRYYLRVLQQLDTSGFVDLTDQYLDLLAKEKVQVYTIKIYRYCGEQG